MSSWRTARSRGKSETPRTGPTKAQTYCTYCPKLCRFVCPVSAVQARETVTPWGKQTILHEIVRQTLPLDESAALPLWACLECHGCRTYCDHGIEVPASLRAGRVLAWNHQVAPKPAATLVHGFSERQRRMQLNVAAFAADRAVSAETKLALFPGCKACLDHPADVAAALRVLDVGPNGRAALVADYCCGLPLLQAGDRDGFLAAARRVRRALSGIPFTVVPDPGCLHALRVLYVEAGVTIDTRLLHLSEAVLPVLGRFRKLSLGGPAFYHDPCHLGRDLGIYDAPRDVFSRVLGEGISEFPRNREKADCCGGGGAVPDVYPDTASAVARRRLEPLGKPDGSSTVVTACPSCREMLAAAGSGWQVKDMIELLNEALL
ncbi:MAG: (Fe-S)-binding protein [Deltaproteobacteria bacterium]|nr:(Fe-S)-binding protein [Deltaproteobacteria bacterium]